MEPQRNYPQAIYRLCVGLLSLGCLLLIFPYIASVVLMLVLAFLLTTTLLPSVDSLERYIGSRKWSVFLVTIVVMGTMGFFLLSFVSKFVQQAIDLSILLQRKDYVSALTALANEIYEAFPIFVKEMLPATSDLIKALQSSVSYILYKLLSFASVIGHLLFFMTMVMIFTVILLLEYYNFKRSLVRFIPNKYFEIGLRLISNIEQQVSKYLLGQLLVASSVATMTILGLTLLHLPGMNFTLHVFLGLTAGLATLIPLVGAIAGMVATLAIGVINNLSNEAALTHQLFGVVPSPFYALDILLMFFIIQQIEGNLVSPTLVGKSVGLHPILVIIALLIGGTLLGPLGMLFAVPTAGIMKVIGQEVAFVSRHAHLM
jgi:predicted PurR-regulated permease PerM